MCAPEGAWRRPASPRRGPPGRAGPLAWAHAPPSPLRRRRSARPTRWGPSLPPARSSSGACRCGWTTSSPSAAPS
eukprot:15476539-Alexandrium_andersonii.AAC.1